VVDVDVDRVASFIETVSQLLFVYGQKASCHTRTDVTIESPGYTITGELW